MNNTPTLLSRGLDRWETFWHEPVRAERLDAVRVCVALAVLADLLVQYLPNLAHCFGPEGVAPPGVNDAYLLQQWRWPVLFFNTGSMAWTWAVFGVWAAAAVCMLVGWHTRWAIAMVWAAAMCFLSCNPNVRNAGDDTLQILLFVLLIAPCGAALSLDASRRRTDQDRPAMVAPWAIRLLQIQLCVIYVTTGLAKLQGTSWWDGTSMHYILNDVTITRWPYAALPVPFWMSAAATYVTVWWEVLFIPLVIWSKTRRIALWMGVALHVGIFMTLEVGWFSFYTLAMYVTWLPDRWWAKRDGSRFVGEGVGDRLGAPLGIETGEGR